MSEEFEQTLFTNVLKLLNKAGQDPRLTPRILRKKLEERMNLPEGELKSKRELIKTHIFKWFKKNCAGKYMIYLIILFDYYQIIIIIIIII